MFLFAHHFLTIDFLINFFLTQRLRKSLKINFTIIVLLLEKRMIIIEEKQGKYECTSLCCIEEIKKNFTLYKIYILHYTKNYRCKHIKSIPLFIS